VTPDCLVKKKVKFAEKKMKEQYLNPEKQKSTATFSRIDF